MKSKHNINIKAIKTTIIEVLNLLLYTLLL